MTPINYKLQKNLEKDFYEKVVPDFYAKMTALIKCNTEGKGFFIGDKVLNIK